MDEYQHAPQILDALKARLNREGALADEVDYIIEFNDGRVLAFEVKANERVAGADLKGLRTLRDALGDRFIAGVALSTGLRSFTYEDRIHIMPIDRLWTPTSGHP